LLDRLKNMLGGSTAAGRTPAGAGSGLLRREALQTEPITRQSNGLDQFFGSLRDRGTLSLLDFAGASQENVSFMTSMGHRLCSQDFVRGLEQTFGRTGVVQGQVDPLLVDQFVSENLQFEPDSFDGALVWDALQFLSPHLLQLTVDRLYETLKPDASLLAFFNANEKAQTIPVYHYRIGDSHTLHLSPRGEMEAAQYFNNRCIEKLFHRFQSVKFFLAKDYLREIIVRR
jgi:hypothetical protein